MLVFCFWFLLVWGVEDEAVSVPVMAAPVLDNRVDAREWATAKRIELPGQGKVLLGGDRETLYFAVEEMPSTRFGFSCIFVKTADHILILHASAQLGSATYRPQNGVWQPDHPKYVWKKAELMWREEQWRAGVNPEGSQEFAVSRDLLGDQPTIALGYIYGGQKGVAAVGWPAALDDGTRNIKLLSGYNPADLSFATDGWARLKLPGR